MGGKRPGPEPDSLRIEGKGWEDAFREALGAKRPPSGWPGRTVKKRKKRRKAKGK